MTDLVQHLAPTVDLGDVMHAIRETSDGPVFLYEPVCPGWNPCPAAVLSSLRKVTQTIREQMPWCYAPEREALILVLGPPGRA